MPSRSGWFGGGRGEGPPGLEVVEEGLVEAYGPVAEGAVEFDRFVEREIAEGADGSFPEAGGGFGGVRAGGWWYGWCVFVFVVGVGVGVGAVGCGGGPGVVEE